MSTPRLLAPLSFIGAAFPPIWVVACLLGLDLLGVGWRVLAEAGRPRERCTLQRPLDDDREEALEVLDPGEDVRPRAELDREDLFTLYETDLTLLAVAPSWQSLRSFSVINFR